MTVAENLCDSIFMIYRGNKVLDGTLTAIQNEYGNNTIRVSVLAQRENEGRNFGLVWGFCG